MPDVSVSDVVQVTYVGRLFEQKIMTTFHYQLEIVTGVVNYESAIVGLDGALSAAGNLLDDYLDCLQSDVTIDEAWYQMIYPTRLYLQRKTKGVPGTRVAASGTANLSTAIERRTFTANHRSVGGIRMPTAADAGSVVDGKITAGLKTALLALATTMLQSAVTNAGVLTWKPVLYGPARPAKPPKPALPAIVQDLVATTVMDTARVNRRRTLGLGI